MRFRSLVYASTWRRLPLYEQTLRYNCRHPVSGEQIVQALALLRFRP